MDTEDLFDRITNNSITEEAENIISNTCNQELRYNQTFNVKLPKAKDQVLLDAYSVVKIKNECKKAKEVKFSFAELLLGISSLLLGSSISAVISQVTYEFQFLSVLFYTVCPTLGIGFGVAYFFCRKNDTNDIKKFAETIEDCILNVNDKIGEE